MKNKTTKYIFAAFLSLALLVYGTSYYVNEQKRAIIDKIIIEVVEQEKTLSNIAEITDRNGADAVVSEIIVDCSIANRTRFDSLLDRLGELGRADLLETQNLFDACARFYSSRKAVMVARMEREFEVYQDMVELLSTVDDAITVERYQVENWAQLVLLEQKRSSIFDDQVDIQQAIIVNLLDGESVASESIQLKLAEAANINEEAIVVNQRIDELRSDLLAL